MTMLERILRWRAIFQAEQAQQPTVDALEVARERRRRAQAEAQAEEVAMHVAYKGYYVEGEPLAGPAMPRTDGMADLFQAQRDAFDWRARVDDAQAQDIHDGGRG